jgi:CheY-like chemotaxis protein
MPILHHNDIEDSKRPSGARLATFSPGMRANGTGVVVAVFNTNSELVDMLRAAFERAGMTVVAARMNGTPRDTYIAGFVARHQPDVIVYDLAPPYDRSRQLLDRVRDLPAMRSRQFVITSTNAAAANALSRSPDGIFEIIGQPYDIDAITTAVKQASRARPTR